MYQQGRDYGINYIKTRKDHKCYGMGLGIMLLDDAYPAFPGDVRNASAFPYPIHYEICEGVDIKQLLYQEDKSPCLEPILKTAKKIESMGCKALAAECGYFAYFQKDVAGYVDIPVFMSSLLQVPFIQQTIGPKKSVGILCAKKGVMTDTHLENVGIDLNSNFFVCGAQDEYTNTQFDSLWDPFVRPDVPEAYYDKAEKEIIAACIDMKHKHPEMGAIMLECTGMQPFARAIQREVDLPVFSWSTLMDYAYSIIAHRDFYGHV